MENSSFNSKQVREGVVPLLSALIRNRCVNEGRADSGGEIRSAQLLQNFFQQSGIDSVIDSAAEGGGERSSLIVSIPGSSAGGPVYGLMGHLDVVPADAASWSFDPFAGESDDEWVYGRGALDMLGQVAVMACALKDVISELGNPVRSVKFIALADEEAEGILGAGRLLKNVPDLVACDYMVTELGGYFLDPGHIAVAACEKGVLRLKVATGGKAAHGSMPYRADNAVLKLSRALLRLEGAFDEPVYTAEAVAMINGMPLDESLKSDLMDKETLASGLDQLYESSPGLAKLVHSALHVTLSPGLMKGGSKVNVIPDRAVAHLDVRIPPGLDDQFVVDRVEAVLTDLDCSVEPREYFPPNSSSLDNSFTGALEDVTREFYPEAKLVPVVPAGVTDGRYWRQAGCNVYGYSLHSSDYTYDFFSTGLHGKDEKIDVASLEVGYLFFCRLLKRLLY